MKKIILSTLFFLPFLSFGQAAYTSTFDIIWPDESKSTISVNYSGTSTSIFASSDDYYTLKSDSSIEFNSQKGTEYTHLNPHIKNCQDTTVFHFAVENLYLGKSDENICTSLPFGGPAQILFRNAKNPLLIGKLTYNVSQFTYCQIYIDNICHSGYSSYESINFTSYVLNSDKIQKPITEFVITGITEVTNTNTTLNISPNPFTSSVQVESTQYANFQLTTVTGKVLKTNLPTNQSLDLSDLESGIYIAQFDNGVLYKRIVKQ